jgi:hypothetical protein
MKRARFFLIVLCAIGAFGADWKTAEPGWQYEFPRDHHAHRDFKTEWWHFTGNALDGKATGFGYELTFFRQGIRPHRRDPNSSRFIVDDLKFAHFALTDVSKTFPFRTKTSRGAFGEAGFDDGKRWPDRQLDARLQRDEALDLWPPVTRRDPSHLRRPNCQSSMAKKASASASASGTLRIIIRSAPANDRRILRRWKVPSFSRRELVRSRGQRANSRRSDWLGLDCLQWDDGTELMLYQMRLKNGRRFEFERHLIASV